MHKEVAMICLVWILLASAVFSFPDDTLRVDKDIVNVEMEDLKEMDPLFYKTMDARYEIVRFTIKNYYTEETEFMVNVSAEYLSGDPITDACEEAGKFCFPGEHVFISYPERKVVGSLDFSQMLIDIGVLETAPHGRFLIDIRILALDQLYAEQRLTLNIGETNFVFGKENTDEDANRILPLLVLFAFLLALLVFGLVLLSKGRSGY
jgi:hypothetical protein